MHCVLGALVLRGWAPGGVVAVWSLRVMHRQLRTPPLQLPMLTAVACSAAGRMAFRPAFHTLAAHTQPGLRY